MSPLRWHNSARNTPGKPCRRKTFLFADRAKFPITFVKPPLAFQHFANTQKKENWTKEVNNIIVISWLKWRNNHGPFNKSIWCHNYKRNFVFWHLEKVFACYCGVCDLFLRLWSFREWKRQFSTFEVIIRRFLLAFLFSLRFFTKSFKMLPFHFSSAKRDVQPPDTMYYFHIIIASTSA